MLGANLTINAEPTEITPDRIVVRTADVTDIYNRAYYRLIPEVEQDGPIQPAGRPAPVADHAGQA
jgi:hypothetical protein